MSNFTMTMNGGF